MKRYSIFNNNTMTKYYIIEGPDGVGKTTFIENFKAYLNHPQTPAVSRIATMDPDERTDLESVVRDEIASSRFPSVELAKILLKQLNIEIAPMPAFSVAVATISKATKENAEFTRKIHAGELSQKEIADGYLQVIYDHHNAALVLGETHDIVLLDRSLPSFYALQLYTMGFTQHMDNWLKVLNITRQNQFTLVYLSADIEVINERLASKRGESVLDEIYGTRVKNVIAGYEDMLEAGFWKDVIHVDTNEESLETYIPAFEAILDRSRYEDPRVLQALNAAHGIAPVSLGNAVNL